MTRYSSMMSGILLYILLLFPHTSQAGNGPLGLGIMLGEPTGISTKYWLNSTTAIDGGMAWSFADKTRLHVHVDWLQHNFSLLTDELSIDKGKLPLYYGIGGRVKFDDDTRAGIRFVVGVAYIFDDAPIDIFFEIAPVMDIAPATRLSGNAFLGARFWFQ